MKHKNFANDGFAIWLERDKKQCDVHINEWLMPSKEVFFIDFGIRVNLEGSSNKIMVYVPFCVLKDEISDLYEYLTDEDTFRGIFNANCEIKEIVTDKISEIKYNDRKENIIRLSSLNICSKKYCEGSLISFDTEQIFNKLTTQEIYFRFRIKHKTLKDLFTHKTQIGTSLFESPVIKYQYYYFMKINEKRALPEKIVHNSIFDHNIINKIIVTIFCEGIYDVDDKECYKIRLLEKKLHENYAPPHFNCEDVVVYQWYNNSRSNYNFNFVISNKSISKMSLFIYTVIAIVFSAVGSAVVQFISKLFFMG